MKYAVFIMSLVGVVLSGAVFAAVAEKPAVPPAVCRMVTKHTPNADVAYQAGVDVHGKSVAPADLPGAAPMQIPQTFTIPLTLQLAKALNLNTAQFPANQLGSTTEIPLGTLSVTGDKVLLDGQPLSDQQQDNLAVLCIQPEG
jgi:hypothetical protein